MSVVWVRLQACTSGDSGKAGWSARITFLRRLVMLIGRRLPLTLAFAVLIVVAFGAGCHGFFTSPTLASFVISPTTPTVPYKGTTQMHAFGTDSSGNPMGDVTSQITWTSKAPGTISVGTNTGLLTGVQLSTSTVEIDANYQALSQQSTNATVCVENGTNFQILPNNTSVTGGTQVDFTASTDALVSGVTTTVDITSAIAWSSGNTAVVTIVSGTDPAIATTTTVTQSTPVTITATYNCNGTTNTFTTTLTVQ